MLLQGDEEQLHLLPALPDQWAEGSVRGLCARGGLTLDMAWGEGGRHVEATIFSQRKGKVKVTCGSRTVVAKLKKGKATKVRF
jgi:alpha-L-fucosidase 2